ncbi:MAG: LAGLIDADG family homing endonuclease, partial [Gammaproteobacteria bacterium]
MKKAQPIPLENPEDIPIQPASADIWDTKYRLKAKDGQVLDATVDATWQRVARALAEVEAPKLREHWYEHFLWALRRGAIPAGRITSNAGALEYKPATSTINCTVSGSIRDSMNDILDKVHEAGLTLKAGCGIGYCFSTLRPRGAYVAGAGAYTSGPLSFMDIYDKMCFTVSSAGGRRGAQMGTFDVGHPDVVEFIRAKREDGRLRQFNLSLLITEAFMEAVEANADWPLVFPLDRREAEADGTDPADPEQVLWREWPIHDKGYIVNDDGLVACKIYRHIKARRLWDLIMTSTYDYAEPGFVLIDRVNEMNNNWFCEDIRATNPCVTADTWVHTADGPRQVADLIGVPFAARSDGTDYASGADGFFLTGTKPVLKLQTQQGYALRLTADHRVRKVVRRTRWSLDTDWCVASDLRLGDEVLLNNHRAAAEWAGRYTFEEGFLLGLLVGDGTLKNDKAVISVWEPPLAVNGGAEHGRGIHALMDAAETAARTLPHRSDFNGFHPVGGRNEHRMAIGALKHLAAEVGMKAGDKCITPTMERASSDFQRGFLRGLFDSDGSVQGSTQKGISVRLAQSDVPRLEAAQRMLLRLGIVSTLYRDRRPAGKSSLPDGRGGYAEYATRAQHELVISGDNVAEFAERIGFADSDKQRRLETLLAGFKRVMNRERFVAVVAAVEDDGVENVYDVQVPGINAFDGNGLHAHNCGEQPLPPYGSCLLGSVNLTRFVHEPFSENARFDWEEYREVVGVFTRMLDNVVEINGLPLEEQRNEIFRKRRHGMGFLGLGSTLTMLRMKYGSPESLEFTEAVAREMALAGWREGLALAEEKGPAPIMDEEFDVTPEMMRKCPELASDGVKAGDTLPGKVLWARYSRYMRQIAEVDSELADALAERGARFTHHSSIAPTGTISLSLANNASNGIEPSFAHHYFRNVIRAGKKSKEKVDVYSYELLAYRHLVDGEAVTDASDPAHRLPEYFITAEDISPKEHVDIQAAAQKWVDSSISKTANVPTEYPYEDFKNIYVHA